MDDTTGKPNRLGPLIWDGDEARGIGGYYVISEYADSHSVCFVPDETGMGYEPSSHICINRDDCERDAAEHHALHLAIYDMGLRAAAEAALGYAKECVAEHQAGDDEAFFTGVGAMDVAGRILGLAPDHATTPKKRRNHDGASD